MKYLFTRVYLVFLNLNNYLYNHFWFFLKKVKYESFPMISGKIFFKGNGNIFFGKSVKINSGKNSNPIGGDTRTILAVSNNAVLSIGDFSGISNCAIICQEKITIGNYVKIGGGVKIYDTDFHSLDYKNRMETSSDIPKTMPIKIENNAFIGAHSIVLKGICIGENSIIGAGSVLTKNVGPNEIWAGNPARFIRKIE